MTAGKLIGSIAMAEPNAGRLAREMHCRCDSWQVDWFYSYG